MELFKIPDTAPERLRGRILIVQEESGKMYFHVGMDFKPNEEEITYIDGVVTSVATKLELDLTTKTVDVVHLPDPNLN